MINMFIGRDEDDLKRALPGLVMNSQENLKRSTLRQMMNGTLVMKKPVEFKTLKQILSSSIATLVFKSFCRDCGLDAYQSFMFLVDVVWLRSIELGAMDKLEDFGVSDNYEEDDKTKLLFQGLDNIEEDSDDTSSVSSRHSAMSREDSSRRLISIADADSSNGDQPKPDLATRRSFFRRNVDASGSRPKSGPLSPLSISAAGPTTPPPMASPVGSPPSSPRFKKVAFSSKVAWSPENDPEFQKSLSNLPAVNEAMFEQGTSSGLEQDRVQVVFQTEIGKAFAKVMFKAYFGEKSLAQRYKQKSALLGCGKTKEYRMLRDSPQVVLTPKILETLAAVVTKRLHQDVLPKFQQSFVYKVLVMIVDVEQEIGKKRVEHDTDKDMDTPIAFPATPIFRNIWRDIVPSASSL